MIDISIEKEIKTRQDWVDLREAITRFNTPFIGRSDKLFGVFFKKKTRLIGGAMLSRGPDTAYLDILWVDESLRGKGLGSRIMKIAEQELKQLGVGEITLDTFDYQAEPFYEKLGYHRIGVIENFTRGHDRIYMRKAL